MFGGTGYNVYMNVTGATVNVTWGTSLFLARTVFPRIKLASGGWIAFLTETAVANNSKIILPDGQTSLTTTSANVSSSSTEVIAQPNSMTVQGINWTLSGGLANKNITAISNANANCSFNSTMGPAILYLEPKKWDDSTYGNFICIPLITTGSKEIAVGDPVFNGTYSSFVTYGSDTYMKKAVDEYGAIATKEDRTNSNGVATLSFPASQMYLDMVFSAVGTSISGGTASIKGGQIGNVVVKDTEVSSVSSKNLIVVGGSCINSVAANLLGGMTCGSDFTTKTGVGSGQFLIQSMASTYSSSKVALVVAGYDADDTVNAATYLMNKGVETTAGKKYKGTSATSATLEVA
jgi:hypothetical protein